MIEAAAPDVLAVQEIGEPEALADLAARLSGDWQIETATVFEPGHPIRVGVLSRQAIDGVEQVSAFPRLLEPVQADDRGGRIGAMPRGALQVRTAGLELVVCHLKSKLLSFPGGRFSPRDEGERARFGAYALQRRSAEAATVRAAADRLLDGAGGERPVIVLGDLNDVPLAATTQILLGPPGSEIGTAGFDRPDRGDPWRLWNLAPLIPEEQPLHARVRRPQGADRPRARQPLPRHAGERGRHGRRAAAGDRRRPALAPRRARLRPRAGVRDLRPLTLSPRAASPRRACPPARR